MSTDWPGLVRGGGVLARASRGWAEYCVVTTASPWRVAQKMVSTVPRRVLTVESLERAHLESLAGATAGVPRVVGLGSGLALDGAKYVAWRTGASLVQVPSTASNNASFTRSCGCLVNGRREPIRDAPLPEQVLIDPELIATAPGRLNRAGLGDLLCSHTSLVDWELGHRAGREVDWNVPLAERTRQAVQSLGRLAPAIGADETEAFVAILEMGARFGPDFLAYPRARFNAGSEHLFAWCLEQRMGRRFIHGEVVGLGILLMAHIQGNAPEWAAGVIRTARVAFRPAEIGATWADVEGAVLALPAYARDVVAWYTVVDELAGGRGPEHPRLKAAFDRARAFVQGLG